MATYFEKIGLSNMSNEELVLAINELNEEKKRREKEKKYQVALNLRNALREFLDSGAEYDFSVVMGLSGCDLLDIEVDNVCDWCKDDINYVEFDPFDTSVLREIMNELTRWLDK
jgi:c-di-AMP phosphodiesterase-like protein